MCYDRAMNGAEPYTNDGQLIPVGELITLEGDLPPKHHQAARLISLGFTQREVSGKLGISEGRLSVIANSPLFKMVVKQLGEELDRGVEKAQHILAEAAPKAAEVLVDTLDAKDHPRLRKEVAVDILKGVGATKGEGEKSSTTINISDAKLTLIMQTLREIK